RRRDAVELGRHDGVGQVEVLVPRLFVEPDDVVAELPAPAIEQLTPARKAGEHRRHVVGRAPHQPVRALGPEAVDGAAAAEVLRRARDQPHGADALAGGRIDARGDVGRLLRCVVPLRDAPGGFRERGMPGHVVDALAVQEHDASVAEAREIVGAAAHGRTVAHPSGEAQAERGMIDRVPVSAAVNSGSSNVFGVPLPRKEDARLVTGRGLYTGDAELPRMLHVAFVRSLYAHALIRGVETTAASAAPGVVTVATGAGPGLTPHGVRATSALPTYVETEQPILAAMKARFAGEAVAAAVARDRYAAA